MPDLSLNLRPWSHFIAVAKAGSLTRAAAQLCIAQPVLSRQLAELERQLGTKLLRRHARGVHLTSSGQVFMERAQQVLDEIQASTHDLAGEDRVPAGALSIGMPPAMSTLVTVDAVTRFSQSHPQIKLCLVHLTSETCYEMLVDRQLDVAVIGGRQGQRGIRVEPLVSESLFLAGATGNPLLSRASIRMKDIGDIPVMMPPHPSHLNHVVGSELARHGQRLNCSLEADALTISNLVRSGFGNAIIAESARFGFLPKPIKFVRIEDMLVDWSVATLSYRPVSPAAKAFALTLQRIVQEKAATRDWTSATLSASAH